MTFAPPLTAPDLEAVQQLEAALHALRTKGWCRGKFNDLTTGQCCSLGALGAPFGPNDWPAATEYLAHAIRESSSVTANRNMRDLAAQMVVLRYNDMPRRKFEEVEAIFIAAIRYAQGQGVSARG